MSIDFEEVKGKIRGPTVSIVAPFKDSNELNIEAVKEYIRFIMDGGITNNEGNILCPGGIGQLLALSHEENRMMVEAGVEVAGDKLLVVAAFDTCNYREAIELSLNAAEAGAKCVLIPPPFYYAISQADIYRWYKVIAEEIKTKIAIMVYSQPWRNLGTFISVPLMGKLAEIENIISIKYGGEMKDYIAALGLYSKRFAFIDNSPEADTTAAVAHMHGAVGYVTCPGAFWPEYEAKYWSLLEQGKYEEAAKWHDKLSPFWEFWKRGGGDIKGGEFGGTEGSFFDTSIQKAALECVGLYGGPVRLPFIELTKGQKNKLFGIFEAIGVPKKR